MNTISTISGLRNTPAVYALFGGNGRTRYVAYVGIAKNLRSRGDQHLVRKDSTVATGTTATCLNPDYVTEVRWWKHKKFRGKVNREAAELVAYDVLEPALRSRGAITHDARVLAKRQKFRAEMTRPFEGEPSGQLKIPTLQDALNRLATCEEMLAELSGKVARLEPKM